MERSEKEEEEKETQIVTWSAELRSRSKVNQGFSTDFQLDIVWQYFK